MPLDTINDQTMPIWLKSYIKQMEIYLKQTRGCRGRDRMVVGFTTTCTISSFHH